MQTAARLDPSFTIQHGGQGVAQEMLPHRYRDETRVQQSKPL